MQFKLFGIPIRVNPFFLLIAAYIGYINAQARPMVDDIMALVVTVPIVFFAVLAHELGHAFAGRAFKLTPQIDLHGFGGLTSWTEGRRLTPGRSIFVSFAGPLVGIAFGTPTLVWMMAAEPSQPLAAFALEMFVFVNLGWGVLNLIPMMPLDGGNIMASFFEIFAGGKGRVAARYVSLGLAGLILLWALSVMNIWILVLVGFMAWSNFKALQAERQIGADMPILEGVRGVQQLLEKGDPAGAARQAEKLIPSAKTPLVRQELHNMLAAARYAQGDVNGARMALTVIEQAGLKPDPGLWGAIRLDLGDTEGAVSHLERALGSGKNPFVDQKLAEAYVKGGMFNRALAFYSSEPGEAASRRSVATVGEAARSAGAETEARHLAELAESKK